MKLSVRLFITVYLTLCCHITSALSFDLLPYTASYASTYKGFKARAEHQLFKTIEGHYQHTTRAKLFFLGFSENSAFTLDGNKVVPMSYEFKGKGGSKKDMSINFDWQNKLVSNHAGKSKWQLPLEGMNYDKLNQFIQLRTDLMTIDRDIEMLPKTYAVIDNNRIKHYQVTVLGEDNIKFKNGVLRCIKVEHKNVKKNKKTILWLAKDWQYLLVGLERIEDNNVEYSLRIKKATVGDQPLTPHIKQ